MSTQPRKVETKHPAPASGIRYAAPCGLDCGRCVMCSHGKVAENARAIRGVLGPNFARYAAFLQDMQPALVHYPAFAELLDAMAEGCCEGCRDREMPCHASCRVPECTRAHGVDWCGLCPDFPCTGTGLPERLVEKWREANTIIRDAGVDAWLRELAERPRYL